MYRDHQRARRNHRERQVRRDRQDLILRFSKRWLTKSGVDTMSLPAVLYLQAGCSLPRSVKIRACALLGKVETLIFTQVSHS